MAVCTLRSLERNGCSVLEAGYLCLSRNHWSSVHARKQEKLSHVTSEGGGREAVATSWIHSLTKVDR